VEIESATVPQTQAFDFRQPQAFDFRQPQAFDFRQTQAFDFRQPQAFDFRQPDGRYLFSGLRCRASSCRQLGYISGANNQPSVF
jgi:hypothetical protein